MSFNDLILQILGISPAQVIQLLGIIFTILYFIFTLVIIRQVQLMTRALITMLSPFVMFFAIINVGITLFVLIILIGTF